MASMMIHKRKGGNAAKNTVVVVCAYTPEQGAGWAVERYGPEIGADGSNVRTTESRWTNRERAIREGCKLANELGADMAIY